MNYPNLNNGFNIRKFLTVFAFILLVFYGVWNARVYIQGPSIELFGLKNNTEIDANPVYIQGLAKNVSFLSLNDKKITVDSLGRFDEKMLLNEGYNTIIFYARDRFQQETTEELKIYLKGTN